MDRIPANVCSFVLGGLVVILGFAVWQHDANMIIGISMFLAADLIALLSVY